MGQFEKMFHTGGSQLLKYKYAASSNEVQRDNLVNSVNQIYTRDALNRMSERDVKLNANVLSSEAYGYDPMSRMTSTLREDGKTDAFTYYLDGELWTATYGNPSPTRTVTYNIDQMGNRTSVVDTGVTTNYTPDSGGLNQYSQVATNTVGNGSEHEIALYQNIAYTYVNDERLSSITSGGNTYTLTYDALGRCVSHTLNELDRRRDRELPLRCFRSANNQRRCPYFIRLRQIASCSRAASTHQPSGSMNTALAPITRVWAASPAKTRKVSTPGTTIC